MLTYIFSTVVQADIFNSNSMDCQNAFDYYRKIKETEAPKS